MTCDAHHKFQGAPRKPTRIGVPLRVNLGCRLSGTFIAPQVPIAELPCSQLSLVTLVAIVAKTPKNDRFTLDKPKLLGVYISSTGCVSTPEPKRIVGSIYPRVALGTVDSVILQGLSHSTRCRHSTQSSVTTTAIAVPPICLDGMIIMSRIPCWLP